MHIRLHLSPFFSPAERLPTQIISLPTEVQARIDYWQMIAEEIIAKVVQA